MLGVSVDPWQYLLDQDKIDPEVHGMTVTDWRYSPLVNQVRYLRPQSLDFAWVPGGPVGAGAGVDSLQLGLLLAAVGLAAVVAVLCLRPPPVRVAVSLLAVTALVVLLAGCVSLRRSFPAVEPYYLDLTTKLQRYEPVVAGVLFSDYVHNYAFLDTNKTRLPTIGRGEQAPLGPEDLARLGWLLDEVARSPAAAPQLVHITPERPEGQRKGFERWLKERAYLLETTWFGQVRFVRYAFPGGQVQRPDEALQPVNADLGGFARLQGYRAAAMRDSPADTADEGGPRHLLVALLWEALAPVDRDYTVFVQLLDGSGKVVAQQDQPPVGGMRPTTAWRPGEEILDLHAIPLPRNVPSELTLIAGLYDPASGARVPLRAEKADFATLGLVTLEASAPESR